MAAGTAGLPGAGPALIVSYLLTAVACGFAALCYAEIAALVPVAGSAYSYAYAGAWRDLGLDHRMGSDHRIRDWKRLLRAKLGGLFPIFLARGVRGRSAGMDGLRLSKRRRGSRHSRGRAAYRGPRRGVQSSRRRDHGRVDVVAVLRDPGERQGRWRPGVVQADVDHTFHRGRRRLRAARSLASVRAGGMARDLDGGLARLFLVHRVRRGFDRGRGNPQSPARVAPRDDRVACDSAPCCTWRRRR